MLLSFNKIFYYLVIFIVDIIEFFVFLDKIFEYYLFFSQIVFLL